MIFLLSCFHIATFLSSGPKRLFPEYPENSRALSRGISRYSPPYPDGMQGRSSFLSGDARPVEISLFQVINNNKVLR